MQPLQLVLGILLVICSLGLILAILGQSAKSKRLGGAITGGAETFLGKEKGKKADILLNKLTIALAILLCVLTMAIYIFQPEDKKPSNTTSTPATTSQTESGTVSSAESAAESAAESVADESVAESTAE